MIEGTSRFQIGRDFRLNEYRFPESGEIVSSRQLLFLFALFHHAAAELSTLCVAPGRLRELLRTHAAVVHSGRSLPTHMLFALREAGRRKGGESQGQSKAEHNEVLARINHFRFSFYLCAPEHVPDIVTAAKSAMHLAARQHCGHLVVSRMLMSRGCNVAMRRRKIARVQGPRRAQEYSSRRTERRRKYHEENNVAVDRPRNADLQNSPLHKILENILRATICDSCRRCYGRSGSCALRPPVQS